jgi:predicted site-specific integrase-resolvase
MGVVRPDRLMTFQQVATFYAVTPRTVRRWVDKGAVSVVRTPSGQPRVPASSVVATSVRRNSDIDGHSGR